MKLNYKNYEIEVFDEPNYTLNSVDNIRTYNKVYFTGKDYEDRFQPTSKHGIIIKELSTEISSAIICEIGGGTGIFENSFIIEDDKIWIRVCNKIYCLELPNLELRWSKELDYATVFEFHKIENDFITRGEMEITRFTKNGEIVWSFGGRDIWVNTKGKTELSIENDKIRLFDFESNEYILSFNGELLEENLNIIRKETKKWWKIFE